MWARSYTSNGCYHWDALYGQHYEIHARYVEEEAASFEGAARDKWQAMVEALEASEDGHLIRRFMTADISDVRPLIALSCKLSLVQSMSCSRNEDCSDQPGLSVKQSGYLNTRCALTLIVVYGASMTSDAEKIAVDLVAATADMRPRFKRLANMILRLRDAHSAHTDLLIAFDTISSVAEANEIAEAGDVQAMHAVPAMISSAIVLYARATKSNSRHRSTLSLSKNFTPEQLEAHRRFCKLRDDAIAHYGPGETYMGGTWHEEGLLLLVDQPANPQIVMTSRRLGIQSRLVVELHSHIHRCIILAQAEIQKREEDLRGEFVRSIIDGDELSIILRAHRVKVGDRYDQNQVMVMDLSSSREGLRTAAIWGSVAPTA